MSWTNIFSRKEVLAPLARHFSVRRVKDLRSGQRILDDRIPEILLTLDRPTFLSIDRTFSDRRWCHPDYAILCFDIDLDQQEKVPELLRALLRIKEFSTRAARMGKVARVTRKWIDVWEFGKQDSRRIGWRGNHTHRRRR